MKYRVCSFRLSIFVLIACAAMAHISFAQTNSGNADSTAKWVGVWQGQLEGVPGVVLTLGDDLGDVSGTIVFTALQEGSAVGHVSIAGRVTHVIMHSHVDGNSLSFKVKRPGNSTAVVDMTLELTGESDAQLRCPKCSAAPTTMHRMQ